jgi:hypothetical protein
VVALAVMASDSKLKAQRDRKAERLRARVEASVIRRRALVSLLVAAGWAAALIAK